MGWDGMGWDMGYGIWDMGWDGIWDGMGYGIGWVGMAWHVMGWRTAHGALHSSDRSGPPAHGRRV